MSVITFPNAVVMRLADTEGSEGSPKYAVFDYRSDTAEYFDGLMSLFEDTHYRRKKLTLMSFSYGALYVLDRAVTIPDEIFARSGRYHAAVPDLAVSERFVYTTSWCCLDVGGDHIRWQFTRRNTHSMCVTYWVYKSYLDKYLSATRILVDRSREPRRRYGIQKAQV